MRPWTVDKGFKCPDEGFVENKKGKEGEDKEVEGFSFFFYDQYEDNYQQDGVEELAVG